jgi:hypothetical protein
MKRVDVSLTKQFEKEYNKLLKDYFNALAKATKEIDFSDGILTKKFKNSLKKHSKMYGQGVENLYKTTLKKADGAVLQAFTEELYDTLPAKFRYHGKKYKFIKMDDIQLFEFISDQWVKSSINNYAATSWVWSKPAIDGIKLSSRIWKHASKSAEDIKKTLLLNLQKGMSAEKMASQLLKTQDMVKPGLPNYLKADLALLSPGAAEDAIRKYTQKKMRFNAFRAARTEIQRAWRGSYVKMAKQLNFIKGIKWNLSASHPEYDICDVLAAEDVGLGPGVYPKDAVPFGGGPAHPQCMCYLTTVMDSVEDWLGKDDKVPKVSEKAKSGREAV